LYSIYKNIKQYINNIKYKYKKSWATFGPFSRKLHRVTLLPNAAGLTICQWQERGDRATRFGRNFANWTVAFFWAVF
jgi:hypothetical protein